MSTDPTKKYCDEDGLPIAVAPAPKKPDRLYKIVDEEGEEYYVSAFNYGEAVHFWREVVAQLAGVEGCQIDEPEVVVLIANEDNFFNR